MLDYDFSQAECLLYEPAHNVRHLLRDALMLQRMASVQAFAQIPDLRNALDAGFADLVIVDAADPASEIFDLIHQLRHGRCGGNPFMGVLVTTFHPTQQLLSRATSSGADALLVKPISPRLVRDRIIGLAEAERKFVVTSDFIGPDRRKAVRGGVSAPPIAVPNSLRTKAMGLADTVDLPREIERASAEINAQKLVRQAFQLTFLFEFARSGLAAGRPDPMVLEHLARIPTVAEDLCRRLPSRGDEDPPLPLAVSARALGQEAQRIRQEGLADRHPEGIDEACRHALELMGALSPGNQPGEMLREVQEAVAVYRARIARFLQTRTGDTGT